MNPPDVKPTAIVPYAHLGPEKTPITFNLYLPASAEGNSGTVTLPTVIFFHGGGLVVGDASWFAQWLYDRVVVSLGYAFISANYPLLGPSTIGDIKTALADLHSFLQTSEIPTAGANSFKVDVERLAVTGASSGGHVAAMAATLWEPKPKAIFTMYPVGGDLLTPFYFKEKTEPFFMGRPLMNPAAMKQFLYPFEGGSTTPISESPVNFDPVTKAPSNIRMGVPVIWIQLGVVLDHYTGLHEPSISAALRKIYEANPNATSEDYAKVIPASVRFAFPQLNVTANWPPSLSFHGDADTAVLLSESQNMEKLLKEAGVDATLMIAPGQEHIFDGQPNAEELWGKEFNAVKDFLAKHLGNA